MLMKQFLMGTYLLYICTIQELSLTGTTGNSTVSDHKKREKLTSSNSKL